MLETRKECREGGVVFYLQEAKSQEDGGAPLTVCLTDGGRLRGAGHAGLPS